MDETCSQRKANLEIEISELEKELRYFDKNIKGNLNRLNKKHKRAVINFYKSKIRRKKQKLKKLELNLTEN